MGTARSVPQARQIYVYSSRPRKTVSALMRSALPISGGVSSQPSSEVMTNADLFTDTVEGWPAGNGDVPFSRKVADAIRQGPGFKMHVAECE